MVGYAFYVLQARRAAPSLAFESSSTAVVTRSDQEVGGLEVRFKGTVVPRLTRTRMALWNPRWAIVDGGDIAESDPLRIGLRAAEILDVRVAAETRSAIRFSVDVRDGSCFINFDFLDRHDGVILDLLHTASEKDRPSIQGTVKGLPAGVSYYGPLTNPPPRKTERSENRGGLPLVIATLSFIGGVIAFAVAATPHHPTHPLHPSHPHRSHWWIGYLIGAALVAIAAVAASVGWSRRLPSTLARARKAVAKAAPPEG